MATYNISRITSAVLRMIGGGIRWIGGVLHITSEDGNTPTDINVNGVEFQNGVKLSGPDSPGLPHELKLPSSPGLPGETLVNDGSGNLSWGSNSSIIPVLETINMSVNQLTYSLSNPPNPTLPILVSINGISVNFTLSGTDITITTYTPGEIDGTEELKTYYYL